MQIIYDKAGQMTTWPNESDNDLMDKAFYGILYVIHVGINMTGLNLTEVHEQVRRIVRAHTTNEGQIAEADLLERDGFFKGKIRIFATREDYDRWLADFEYRQKEERQ